MKINWKEKYRQFREWQERPYQVAPLSPEEHVCATCSTSFKGNYCPRCGQSARIGRYSFKNALLLFLDVWGLGNRGMFRTLRDLIFRPGYMIRDYLRGMQMAYFPPFKMLFLLSAVSVIVAHGVNLRGSSTDEAVNETISFIHQGSEDGSLEASMSIVKWLMDIQERFPTSLTLLTVILLTTFYYLLFRKSKNIPDLRFSEFLIAMVYMANMLTIYDTLLTFLGVSPLIVSAASVLTVIPMKQLSGFSWTRTIVSMLVAIVIFYFLIVFIFGMLYGLLYAFGVFSPIAQ